VRWVLQVYPRVGGEKKKLKYQVDSGVQKMSAERKKPSNYDRLWGCSYGGLSEKDEGTTKVENKGGQELLSFQRCVKMHTPLGVRGKQAGNDLEKGHLGRAQNKACGGVCPFGVLGG